MKISVKIHTNSSQEKIEKSGENKLEIWIKEKPLKNKANLKLKKILKKSFQKNIKIISGLNSKKKIIEISD